MASQLQPSTSPLAPSPSPTVPNSVEGIMAGIPKQQEDLKEEKDSLDKTLATDEQKRGALKPPELQPVPQPTVAQTDPSKIWGSSAMLLAGLGGLLTRRPLVTAMNAASKVFQAYKQNDQEAAKQAFDSWKASNENALKLADFQQKTYEEALKGIDSDEKGALAKYTAAARAFQDETGAKMAEIHGALGAQQHVTELKRLSIEAAKAQGDIEEKNEQHQALMGARNAQKELQQAQASKDPAKIAAAKQKFDDAMSDIHTINAAYGKGGSTGNPRSLPAAFAQKYLAEHPNATAEDLEDAATEYREKQAAAGTLGTRSTQIDLSATEAGNFAEQALAASKAVPREGWQIVNHAIQAGETKASDPKLQKLLVATDALINARARAISPSGQPHLADQIEGRRLLSTSQSAETYEAAVQQMMSEVQGVKDATKSVKGEVLGGKYAKGGNKPDGDRGVAPAHKGGKPIWPDGDHWVYEDGSTVK